MNEEVTYQHLMNPGRTFDEDPLFFESPASDVSEAQYPASESGFISPSVAEPEVILECLEENTAFIGTTPTAGAKETSRFLYERLYLCTFNSCLQTFVSRQKYQDHRVKVHQLPRYECTTCGLSFANYHKLVSHMEDENHFIYCQFCNLMCTSPAASSNHFSLHHRVFWCPGCNLQIFGKSHLKKHEKTCKELALPSHFSCDPLSCDLPCENQGTSEVGMACVESSARSHLNYEKPMEISRTIDPDLSQDNICPVVFGPGANTLLESCEFSSGTNSQHDDQESNVPCAYASINEPTLDVSALMSFTSAEQQSEFPPQENIRKKFRFVCTYCSSKFYSKISLQKHCRKEHNFVCSCGEKYFKKYDFIVHKRTHKSVKTWVCSTCNFKMSNMQLFLLHEMKHELQSLYDSKIIRETDKGNLKRQHAIRIKVWSEWGKIWNDFVKSRSLRLKIEEKEIRKIEDDIKQILETEWNQVLDVRDKDEDDQNDSRKCLNSSQVTPGETTKKPVNENENKVKNLRRKRQNGAKNALQEVTSKVRKTSTKRSAKDGLCESEKTSDLNSQENEEEWMSYWRSYIGLNDNDPDPTWIHEVLDRLRSKYQYFHVNHQEDLYREMDQIAFLVRVQRGEENPLNGLKVVLLKQPVPPPDKTLSSSASHPTSPSAFCPSSQPTGPSSPSTLTSLRSDPKSRWRLPIVVLSRMTSPQPSPSLSVTSSVKKWPEIEEKYRVLLSKFSPDIQHWFIKQTSGIPLPRWAEPLIQKVAKESSRSSSSSKRSKMTQIIALIKAYDEELHPSNKTRSREGAYVNLLAL